MMIDYEKVANEIVSVLKEKAGKKCIRFTLKEEKTDVLGNKISGIPYIPKNGEYPTNTNTGKKLHLLIQLNFERLPKLENYPDRGILQIFIDSDDGYGLNWSDPTEQSSWIIKYYEEIEEAMSEEEVKLLLPDKPDEWYMLPFEDYGKEYTLYTKEDVMAPTPNCREFKGTLDKYCSEYITDDMKDDSFWGIKDELFEPLHDKLYGEGSRIGGYPEFTQSDPREYDKDIEKHELLLQIDSEYCDNSSLLMWGDCGIANFFISLEDLKKKDFKKVYYNWDCC